MKYLDEVRLIVEKEEYAKQGVHKGMQGFIALPEIRYGTFCVSFELAAPDPETHCFLAEPSIAIEDLQLVCSANVTDEVLLDALPGNNPNWWCKAEQGFVLNLKGEKKNKIPYDYKS